MKRSWMKCLQNKIAYQNAWQPLFTSSLKQNFIFLVFFTHTYYLDNQLTICFTWSCLIWAIKHSLQKPKIKQSKLVLCHIKDILIFVDFTTLVLIYQQNPTCLNNWTTVLVSCWPICYYQPWVASGNVLLLIYIKFFFFLEVAAANSSRRGMVI